METKEQLAEIAIVDFRWREAAEGITIDDWVLSEQAEYLGEKLVSNVLKGCITVDELRAGVAWASALDLEAVKMHGVDLSEGDKQLERTARRVMHLSGRVALNCVKSRKRRTEVTVRQANKTGLMVG